VKAQRGVAKLRLLWLLLALLLLSFVIWFGGPYLAFGEYKPLEFPLSRAIAIVVVVVLWGFKTAAREIKAGLAGQRLAKQVARQEDPASARASADAAQLQQRFADAIAALQHTRKGRTSLYELPWYIIIGPPGAGKTTAIINCGLNFPLSQKFGKEALRGVGGTRNCDWWFTDQAILLDTAGRYTTQDSDQVSDAGGWREFLGLLRRYRRRRPINGVLVAMSLTDLVSQSDTARMAHVAAVRARLEELTRELRIALPVYLILTKSDLLAGFAEFFDDLSQEGRAQVWGTTFPVDASRSGSAPEQLAPGFKQLLERLSERAFMRMDAERDVQRRAMIFGFPHQFAGVRRALLAFVSDVFGSDAPGHGIWLRGVYFTSGTQEGTPIDRMLGALARTFGLSVKAIDSQGSRGKAYFLQRLLLDVVFRESGLAGVNRGMELRHGFVHAGTYLGIAASAVLLMLWLIVSDGRNRAYLEEVHTAIQPLATLAPATSGDLAGVLTRLDGYRDALGAATKYSAGVPFSMRAGLYQGHALASAASDGYVHELNAGLAPAIAQAFHERLGQLASDPDKLYEYLKVYLMLGTPDRVVPAELQFMTNLEWRQRFASDEPTVERLNAHMATLLEDKTRIQPVDLDAGLVERARISLRQASLPVLMFSRLKLSYAGDTEHAIQLDKEIGLGGDTLLVHKNGAPLSDPIPALYTHAVFDQVALVGKEKLANDFVGDSWVLGEGVASRADVPRLAAQLMQIYEDNYITVWDRVLADLKLRPQHNGDLGQMMILLASPTSPLKRLLALIDANTNLLKPSNPADKVNSVKSAVAEKVQKVEEMFAGVPAGVRPGARVTQHFQSVHQLVDGPPGGAPIDQTLQAINQIGQQLAKSGGGAGQTSAASAAASGAQADAVRQVQVAAKQLPQPISVIVAQIGSEGASAVIRDARGELARRYEMEVAAECRKLVGGRYPLIAHGTSDIALADFAQVFGPSGVFAKFLNDPLGPLVDNSRDPWRWKEGVAGIGSTSLLDQFQAVDRIRKTYFPPAGQLPEMRFTVTPESLDSNVRRLAINIDGQAVEYRHGPPRPQPLVWPGPAPGQASVLFEEGGGAGPNRSYQGPWALFRLLDDATVQPQSELKYLVTLTAGGHTARVTLEATSVRNPFARNELRGFRCGG
jgi:type VI secretion system protein ImpL